MDESVEVFRCTHEGLAQQVVEAILQPAGIFAVVHNRASSALPAPDSMSGGYFIAVPRDRAQEAAQLLRDAQLDGALSDEGDVAQI